MTIISEMSVERVQGCEVGDPITLALFASERFWMRTAKPGEMCDGVVVARERTELCGVDCYRIEYDPHSFTVPTPAQMEAERRGRIWKAFASLLAVVSAIDRTVGDRYEYQAALVAQDGWRDYLTTDELTDYVERFNKGEKFCWLPPCLRIDVVKVERWV